MTTDGELAQTMAKKGRVQMTYHIKLQGLVKDDAITRLARGWRWEGRPVKPETIDRLAATERNTWIEMVVAESRPRALKAAGELIRHTVLKISRIRLGGAVVRGTADGRLARSHEGRDLRPAPPRGPCLILEPCVEADTSDASSASPRSRHDARV